MIQSCRVLVFACVGLVGLVPWAQAQGTIADYRRADSLRAMTGDKVFKASVKPHWSADDTAFWYRNDLAAGAREFLAVETSQGRRGPAFDHERLAQTLLKATGKSFSADRLPVDRIGEPGEPVVRIEVEGKTWRFDAVEGTLEPADSIKVIEAPPPAARRGGRRGGGSNRSVDSPDGKWVASVKKHNLQLRDKESGEEFALSDDGTEDDHYEAAVFWAPDSKKLVALKTAPAQERKVYLVESSPRDQLQPKLQSYDYLKPGDRIEVRKPHLFDVDSRKAIAVSDALFKEPWSIDEFRWSADSSRFRFLFNQRGHQVLRLVSLDASSGEATTLIEDVSPTFVDYSQKSYRRDLDGGKEILWMSERDGWNHLYLFDAASGRLKNQVTKGEWVVLGVDRIDEESRQVWFRAGGIRPGQDPYHVHHARVNLDGTGLVVLTEGDGTHTVEFSPIGSS